jgi:bacillithiol synthase
MTAPTIISQEIGGSPLAVAAQRGLTNEWYAERPRDIAAWQNYLRTVAHPYENGEWLRALTPALDATGAAALRLDRAAASGGIVVSTGQQAALFGGPMYTLIKALSALAIADVFERETGIATTPLFWAATDDADYDEACWAAFAMTGGLEVVRLPPPEGTGIPMSRQPLREVEPLVARLLAASGSILEARPVELAREAFRSGETLGNAYLRLLRALLAPFGIPVLDASHSAVREAAAPVLRSALDRADEVERTLRMRSDSIRAAGYVPQVEHLPELTLVFEEEAAGQKRRIPVRAASSHSRLPARALGPNVLLRPVVERFIMPSACYVAGPGELAYFAQVGAVADALQLPRPVPVPRWSATILEPRIVRLLDRLGLTRDDLRDVHTIETRLARARVPAAVKDALYSLRRDLEDDVAALETADRDKLVPPASLDGLRRWIEHRVHRLERRYAAGVKRRESEMMQDVATASAALYPQGKPQERVLNFLPFLARYGMPLIDAMRVELAAYARSLLDVSERQPLVERA